MLWLHHSEVGDEGQTPRPKGAPRLAAPSFPCLAGLSHSTCDPGFTTKGWVFFQLLQPVNMTMASVDNGVHGGGGRPGSALAGVPSAVPSLVQRFGVPCWLSGAEPSACSGPSCCPQQASLPPAEGHPVLRGPAGSVSSGGWADGLSAVLE